MTRQKRKEIMDSVSYGYFKLPLQNAADHHGVLTVATAVDQESGTCYYGAALCAPGDMFCRATGKFGSTYVDDDGDVVAIPGAHTRLVRCLTGELGLLQGSTCASPDSRYADARTAAYELLEQIMRKAGSGKLDWVLDVDMDGIVSATKRRKKKAA